MLCARYLVKPERLLTLLRAALSTAVFACAALTIDYRNLTDPAFCSVESSCFKVRASDVGRAIAEWLHARIPGAQLPQVALLAFVGLLASTFFLKGRDHLRLLSAVLVVAAAAAVTLIVAQARIDAYCAYCMIVDVAAIVAMLAALGLLTTGADRTFEKWGGAVMTPRATISWGIAGTVLTVSPFIWGAYPNNPKLPHELEVLQVPGKLTVLSFTDFQCPHCRNLYPTMKQLEAREDVALRRFMVPLPFHPGAMPAALGYICSPEDKAEAMAEALYTAPPEQLTYMGVLEIARQIGVPDTEALRVCMAEPTSKARVELETEFFFDQLGGGGLPTTYVGKTMIRGGGKPEKLLAAADAPPFGLPVWGMFVVAAASLAGALIANLRLAPEPPKKPKDHENA